MDSIGDGSNRIIGEHAVGDFAMVHGHAVDVMKESEGQPGHVQATSRAALHCLKRGSQVVDQNVPDQVYGKLVMTRRH
jgi:hypothetical protein